MLSERQGELRFNAVMVFVMLVFVGVAAAALLAMGRQKSTQVSRSKVAYVLEDSVVMQPEAGSVGYPTLCSIDGEAQRVIFTAPLKAGDTAYFIPYWENDEQSARGWVVQIEKGNGK